MLLRIGQCPRETLPNMKDYKIESNYKPPNWSIRICLLIILIIHFYILLHTIRKESKKETK